MYIYIYIFHMSRMSIGHVYSVYRTYTQRAYRVYAYRKYRVVDKLDIGKVISRFSWLKLEHYGGFQFRA